MPVIGLHRWRRREGVYACQVCGVRWGFIDPDKRMHLRRARWRWPSGAERIEPPRAAGGRHWRCGEEPAAQSEAA